MRLRASQKCEDVAAAISSMKIYKDYIFLRKDEMAGEVQCTDAKILR